MSSGTSRLEGLSPQQMAQLIERLRPAAAAVEGIPRLSRDGAAFAVSTAQERLWFLHRVDRRDTAYTLCAMAVLRGALRWTVLDRALARLRERHEVLRTVFVDTDDGPRQLVSGTVAGNLPLLDLTALEAMARRRLASDLARRLAGEPFDLATGPLFRSWLLRLEPLEHRLVLELHHVVCDAWSMGLLVRDLATLYGGTEGGGAGALPRLPVQYVDYAAWERSRIESPQAREQLEAACAELAGAPVVEVAADRRRPAVRSSRGHRVALRLPAAELVRLRGVAEAAGATLFGALAASLALLLEHHGAGCNLVIGTPVANRRRTELAHLVGFLVNTLPLRLRVAPDKSFAAHLAAVTRVVARAMDRQEVPFDQLVERLVPERSLAHPPLVQVMLALDEAPAALELSGLRVEIEDVANDTAKLDLLWQLRIESDGSLGGWLEASADLFDATTARRIASRFAALLGRVGAAPEAPVGRLPRLTPGERQCLLYEWSGRTLDGAGGLLVDGFLETARCTPEAAAVTGRTVSLTYSELDQASHDLAMVLKDLGAGAETLVAVRMDRTPALVVALLAVLRSGAAYVPIDPAYPVERQRFLVEDSGAGLVLTDRSEAAPVEEDPFAAAVAGQGSGTLRRVVLGSRGEVLSAPSPSPAARAGTGRLPTIRPEQLAYLIYTSGSTGRPKAVAIEHRNAAALLGWAHRCFDASELARVAATTSASFDLSVFELFAPLTVGGSVLVLRDALELAEPGRGAESSGPTLINTVPSAFAELLEQGFGAPGPTTVNLAGEALRGALVDRIYELGGVVRVCNLYGPSEDTTYSTWSVVPAAPEGRGTGGEPTIGRSVDGGRGYVVDGALRAVPVGVTGEIVLGGAGLARGYYHRPRLTAERFVPDPFGDGERLYRTGDLGRFLADGQLEYLGRRDQQVKVRGFRIELGEIEVALGELPGVVEAAVVAVGELSERRLVAFLRLDSEKGWAPETLLARLRGRLPEPLVPTELRPVEALPLTANRKIDRIELRRRAVEERRREAGGVSYRSPRNPLEELLVTLFADLLDRPRVGIDESFFALGGHSLLAARLASRLARALEREVPVPWVFEAPTAARLAARIEHAERRALPPLVPGARPARLPLSPAQERLWFLDRLQPGEAVYHLPMVLDLVGPLDAGALERALLDVVGRHEVLRTRFVEETPGVPAQRVEAVPGSMLARIDVSGAEGLAAELEASWARQPFDLAHRLPLRAVLLRRSEERSSLCLVAHHIAVDGVSLGVLFDELARSYEARLAGRPAELPEVPVQAADHAVWQRQGLRGELLETLLEDARRRLAGAPEVLDLPFDGPAPAVSTNRGETVPVPLPPGTGERLRALARDTRSTPFAVLAAVFETALWRWSGQRDLLLGTPVAQRERAELERAVGLYVNTLVLRGVLDAGTPFREQVAATQRAFLDAYAGRELPFEELVRALGEHRDLGSSPIFQVLLVLQQEVPEPRFSGLETALRPLDVGAARFDLTLAAAFRGGELEAVLELRTDRFESTTRRRLAAQLGRLLTASLAGPDLTLEALELLAPAERQQLLVEWQPGTAARGGLAGDLWGAFAAQAVRRPDAPAVRWGVEVWSYRRLAGLAAEIGGRLLDLGVSTEDVVAVGAARTPRTIAALLGVLRVGGAYLPLDPAYPAARLRAMLDDSGARVAVCDACLEPLLREAAVDVVDLSALSGGEDTSTSAWAEPPNPAIDPRQLAYLIYTSGSTGRAKAVAIEHRSALALLRWSADVFSDDELAGVLAVTSLCFDLSVFELFVPLCRGGTVVLVDDALALSELAAEVPVTLVNTVPSALAAVLKLGGLPTSVETVNLAGEPLRRELVRALRAGSDVRRVWNLYGPSEDTTYSTAARVPLDGAAEPTIGRAVMGSRALVLHDARRLVPLGAVGELCLAGEGLARGYLGQPRRTAESFVPDSLSALPGERLYRTGDLARWGTDGELRFLGRRDHQVKVRGFRVELAEIEVALGRFPEVEEAVVVAVTGSDGSSQLVAYVAAPEGSPGAEELRRRLARQLPPPLVPSRIVVLKGLPHTLTGKIDRRALPAPDLEAGGGTDSEPASAVEEVMVGLFEQALDRRSVGLEDDFFALGGHSLLAVRLVARIREVFGVSLPVRTVFEHPTVRGVARRLEAARRGAEASSVTAPRSGSVPDPAPASWIQERLWFLERLGTDPGAYAMPLALDLEGRLDALALEAALHRVIGRHDVLRTVFDSLDGRPYQRVLAAIPVALPRLDLAGLEEPDRKEVMTRDLERLISAGFDLAAGPLFRMLLVRAGEARHRLLLVAHHAVFDGWSGGLLLREIGAFYRASTRTLEAGDGFREPEPLPLQYADFAVWQRRQGDRHREGLAFYRELLDGAPAVLDLPVDHLHSASAPLRGGLESLRLGAESGARLQALCRRQGVTPFLLLTAAWATILARWSGQRDVVLGAPVSIRDHRDLEPLIGAFLNTLVLRVEIDPASTFAELLAQVRERFLAAYEHRDLPFERLLDELGVERSLERTPLFQVFVNMLSFPAQSLDLPDLTVTVPPPPLPPPKFDLTLYARLADERLEVDLVYDARRFAASTMAEMIRQLGGVLEQIVEGSETPVLALSLRTPEARQVLPDPTRPLSRTWRGPVHRFFARQVQATPERPAVIEDGGESWSYAELYEAVEAVAATLHERGAGPGERVLIFAHRGAALVAAIVGTLRSGAAFSIVDPAYPGERLVAACKRVQPRLLLALEAAGPVPPELLAAVRDSGAAILVLGRRRAEILAALSRGTAPEPDLGPDSPAYVGLTSGSTGLPKGVLGRHGSLSHFTPWMAERFELGEGDRFSLLASLAHDPLHRDVFTPLQLGAPLEVPDAERFAEPGYLARWLARRQVSICHLTPAMVRLLGEGAEDVQAPSLRRIFLVGEALTREHVRRLSALGPAVRCVNLYGSTETQRAVAYFPVSEHPEETGLEVLPLGRGMAGVQLLVEAAGGAGLAGVGELGEISVRSPHIALGYFGDDVLTAERFCQNPASGEAGDTIYRTGDLGRYRADGNVVFAGRRDQQVKVRGFRVELEEIEAALEAEPGVRDAAVAWWPPADRTGIGGDGFLAAYVVAARGTLDFPALRTALARRLPDYMVPAVFEELEALPLTANRKLDRGALPRPELRIEVDAGAAPRGEVEESLAELWRQVLGIESVPRHASFFALGGHSLALTRLAARIAGGLGAEVPLRELFEHHTLAGQARCIAAARPAAGGRAPSPILRHDDTAGPAPLSFAQQRLWFLDQLNPGTAAFNLAFAFRLRGGLDRQALTRALDDVVERHEVLRSRFPSVEGTPRQVPAAEGRNLLPVIDVSRMGAAAEVLIVGLCEAVARRPFDLERGPLVRAVLFARSATEHTTVVSLHHIVTDGWSNGVLVRDLGELYAARAEGRSPRLEELPLAYADFAAWQRESLGAAVLERELEAWREHLRGWPRELDLPTDRPRPAVASLRGRTEPFTLQTPPASLERLAEAGGTTLFPVLLAAFQVLLHHLTGETRMLVGTDVANRRRRELEGLVGFFVNQLVLTGDLEGDPTFGELVERAKAATVFAQDHQDAPFDRVVDAVGIERRLDRSPLFQVKLILQNTPFEPLRLAGVDLEPLPVEKGIAQQDLVVALWQREGVLEGWANFSTDLFRASTVRGWLGDFDGLLAEVVKEPHCRLERLRQSLVVAGTTPSTAQEPKMKKPSLASFKKSPAAAVATRLVERSLPASGSLPLIFSPTTDGVDLVEWLAGERAAVLADLRSHGALFFRGFGVTEPEYFERFATTVCDSLFDENGEHPHESVSGNVYTPVFYSPANKLLWHNENSFNFRWPGKIIFCSVLPAASGGETPVADSRQVYRAIDPEIRDRFEELGVLYRRNYGRGMGLDWQEVFQTDDRRVVEDYCHENRLSFHWRDDGALRTECLRPAVIEHAATGEKSWFNQAQHWHPACLDPATRQSLTSLFSEEDLPRSCSFGDGSPIPDEFMHHVLEVYARLEAVQPWGAGDVMLLDNVLCAHARNPYQGDRKLLVAMGDMGTFEA